MDTNVFLAEAKYLKEENQRLLKALCDAINSVEGHIPDSAIEFNDGMYKLLRTADNVLVHECNILYCYHCSGEVYKSSVPNMRYCHICYKAFDISKCYSIPKVIK